MYRIIEEYCNRIVIGGEICIPLALLLIAFWGEPDLIDAIVYWLTGVMR